LHITISLPFSLCFVLFCILICNNHLIGVSRWGSSSWSSQGRRGCCAL